MADPFRKPVRAKVWAVLAGLACTGPAFADTLGEIPASVAETIRMLREKPAHAHATIGFHVVDIEEDRVLLNENSDLAMVPGSIQKIYSTATVLDLLGPDYRFATPVYRNGDIVEGTLEGDLVLVASGDFNFGLRDQPDGTLGYNNMPEIDHNYADTGFAGGALVEGSDPLRALRQLAKEVREEGIRRITGQVLVDARLFDPFDGWADGTIAPAWLNENVIDVIATPAAPGELAKIEVRPALDFLQVKGEVLTVSGEAGGVTLSRDENGVIVISGEVAAEEPPVLSILHVQSPVAFLQAAFVEMLTKEGVELDTEVLARAPDKSLPAQGRYNEEWKVAEYVSPPLSEFVKVVLKVSYNRGADLLLCMAAVQSGSRDCSEGLRPALTLLERLGASRTSTVLFDGAGSDDRARTTPSDATKVLAAIQRQTWGQALRQGMAILGVDGTQAANAQDRAAAGHVHIKDGSRVALTPHDLQGLIIAKTQMGYIETASGRNLAYAIFINNVPYNEFEDFIAVDEDISALAAAIFETY